MKFGNNSDVRAVMFDMGNVLVDLNVKRGMEAFVNDAGLVTIGDYLDPCHQRGFFGLFENGLIDEEQFYQECISRSKPGTDRLTVRECIHQMLDGIDPAKAELLNRLKCHCNLYLLTNNNPIAMYYCSRLFEDAGIPLESTFQKLFYSYRMKMVKPDPAFFLECIRLCGCKAGEIVFVDDSMANVNAAAELGIDARYYEPRTDLEAVLQPCFS